MRPSLVGDYAQVSIVTEEGIEQLKYAVLDLLRNQVSLQQESELAM